MSRRISLFGIVCTLGLLALSAGASAKTQRLSAGVYEGTGRLTGGFSGNGVTVSITGGGKFQFCAHVSKTGLISPFKSHWAIEPTTISVQPASGVGAGTGTVDAFGTLGGYIRQHGTLYIAIGGTERVTATVNFGFFSYTLPTMSFDVIGDLPIHRSSSHGFKGDLALKARQAQQASGLSSTETAKYTAKPVKHCVTVEPPTLG